jgi:hypothetical protein
LFFNPNSSVWVESDKVAANFLAEFAEERAGKFGKRASRANKSPFPLVALGTAHVRTLFSPEDEPVPKIVEVIDRAKKSVEVMAFVLSSREIGEALIQAHKRGVRVRVLLDKPLQPLPVFGVAVPAGSPTDAWRLSAHPAVQQALRHAYFDSLGLPRLAVPSNASSGRTAGVTDPYGRWCGGWSRKAPRTFSPPASFSHWACWRDLRWHRKVLSSRRA